MADATEDLLEQPSSASSTVQHDDDDNELRSSAQDLSDSEAEDIAPNFLNLSLSSSSKSKGALPKRGLKDFEANPTLLQSRNLAASRQAMHEALSHVRVHNPKDAVVGVYDEASGETFVSRARARGKMFSTVGRWRRDGTGGFRHGWDKHGADVEVGYILEPEEALWALESGRLDVRYPTTKDDALNGSARQEEEIDAQERESYESTTEDLGMPMSLQGAYAAYIGDEPHRGGKLTLDRYIVYTALRRAGYVVTRAGGWDSKRASSPPLNETNAEDSKGQDNTDTRGLFSWLYNLLFTPKRETEAESHARQRVGPLVAPGLYRSYNDIYRLLQLIPLHTSQDSHLDMHSQDPQDSPFTTTYNVYKSSPTFRKSAPGPADFRICVISARDTAVPTLEQLSQVMDEQTPLVPAAAPDTVPFGPHARGEGHADVDRQANQGDSQNGPPGTTPTTASGTTKSERKPPERGTKRRELDARFAAPNTGTVGHTYARLKRGRRNVILAIVDEGIVSYLRFADAEFGGEKLFERVGSVAGKRGGKGGSRGQGRARGGGNG